MNLYCELITLGFEKQLGFIVSFVHKHTQTLTYIACQDTDLKKKKHFSPPTAKYSHFAAFWMPAAQHSLLLWKHVAVIPLFAQITNYVSF